MLLKKTDIQILDTFFLLFAYANLNFVCNLEILFLLVRGLYLPRTIIDFPIDHRIIEIIPFFVDVVRRK